MEYQKSGTRLVVRDTLEGGSAIRNRAGEPLAELLKQNRKVRCLDISEAGITDNGVAHLCLHLRQADQLEELRLSPVGHAGLEFLLGVVKRCSRLRVLSIRVEDVATRATAAHNIVPGDYNTSAFEKQPNEEEDEEEEEAEADEGEEEDPAVAKQKKLEKLRKIFAENDYDSGDEGGKTEGASSMSGAGEGKPPSAVLARLLAQLVPAVRGQENLTYVECLGEAVPEDVRMDLARAVDDHVQQQNRQAEMKEERGARTAYDSLKDQMEELRAFVEGGKATGSGQAGLLPGETADAGSTDDARTHLDIRAYVGRRLFAALGESLFECQRFKSKENEAVATWQGECAFMAMYLRKLAKERGR